MKIVASKFKWTFIGRKVPNKTIIWRLIQKFRKKGAVLNQFKENAGRQRAVRTPENIKKVLIATKKSRNQSLKSLSQSTEISRTNVQRIIRKDLQFYPYKI